MPSSPLPVLSRVSSSVSRRLPSSRSCLRQRSFSSVAPQSSSTQPAQSPTSIDQSPLPPTVANARSYKPHLNYQYIRDNAETVTKNVASRKVEVDVARVVELYKQVSSCTYELDQLRKRRNQIASAIAAESKSKKMSSADNSNDSPGKGGVANLRAEGITLKRDIQAKESHLSLLESALYEEARHIPNDTHPSTPVGDESACEVILTIGEPRPNPNGWALKDHFALAQLHDMADFDRAGKVTGNSFYYLKNTGALLELAMIRYTMDVCVRHGFVPILTPDLVRHEIVEACGFSPRSSDPQTYFIQPPFIAPSQQPRPSSVTIPTPGNDPLQLTLTATAEFPLCAMHANEVLMPSTLPVKMVGFGHSFRAEGTTGGTNRGLYRVHQFSKVEMFALTRPEQSDKILEEFREIQTEIFTSLGLCFRVLNMSTEELGAPAYKKYDMEAWMPARNEWGEISSASNCTDYQSRRLNIRHFTATATSATSAEFVHTVNGTACAVPRLIIAILETFQNEKGEIEIPKVLRPYFLGANVEKIIPGKSVRELLLAKS